MISVEEMRKLLEEEYGITSDEQLCEELEKLGGGINISVFTEPPNKNSDVIA